MAREKKAAPGSNAGQHAKDRHKKDRKAGPGSNAGQHAKESHKRDRKGVLHDWSGPVPQGLVAKPHIAQRKSKHKSYFEFVENKEKKKKLEYQITTNKDPPPGFEFVPIGNPALTTACKELSREQDAMIFIVSTAKSDDAKELSLALNRVGHHIRESIVEQARVSLGDSEFAHFAADHGVPEPIPENQELINKQADAAIKDLFPRIPNADRETIIQHSFKLGAHMKGTPLVGLAPDITLSRRVQLAVLAHIRHTHTRYDQLLRETTYVNARKVVESLCLDILVKWRGDEETGRDQLEEILREVVVISDSEGEEDEGDEDAEDEESDSESTRDSSAPELPSVGPRGTPAAIANLQELPIRQTYAALTSPGHLNDRAVPQPEARRLAAKAAKRERKAAKETRGFQRYRAVRRKWDEAVERRRPGAHGSASPVAQIPTQQAASSVPQTLDARPSSYDYPAYHPKVPYDDYGYSMRSDNPRTIAVSQPQYFSADGRASTAESVHRSRPIAGSRVDAFEPSPGPRSAVSYRDERLKDCLVRSIEQQSPEPSYSSYQASRSHPSGPPYSEQTPGQSASAWPGSRNVAPGFHYEEPLNGHYIADDERDFLMAQSGRGLDKIPPSSVAYSDPRAAPSYPRAPSVAYSVARPQEVARQPSPVAYPQTSTAAQDGRFIRQELRPTFVEDVRYPAAPRQEPHSFLLGSRDSQHGDVRREDVRPVVISNYGARTQREEVLVRQPYASYREQPRATEPEIIEVRRQPIEQRRAHLDPRTGPPPYMGYAPVMREESRMPVEFIPVSNAFPRPHTTLAPREGYLPTSNNPVPNTRYVARREEPSRVQYEYLPPAPQLLGARGGFPREERVVRVEYADHSYRDREGDYGQRIQPREQEHRFRQHDTSTVPQSFIDDEQRQAEERALRRDGVVYMR